MFITTITETISTDRKFLDKYKDDLDYLQKKLIVGSIALEGVGALFLVWSSVHICYGIGAIYRGDVTNGLINLIIGCAIRIIGRDAVKLGANMIIPGRFRQPPTCLLVSDSRALTGTLIAGPIIRCIKR